MDIITVLIIMAVIVALALMPYIIKGGVTLALVVFTAFLGLLVALTWPIRWLFKGKR